jgi:GT2 family glycosyltransferase
VGKFASLVVLAYKRPHLLARVLDSIISTADYPYQLVVNLDGADQTNIEILLKYLGANLISNLLISSGNNRGVGRSFQSGLGVCEGEYIFKIDTDLIFKEKWLSTSVKILDNNPDIGAVSCFDYHNYDPNDSRFTPENNRVKNREDCIVVKDFVSSIYGFRAKELKPDTQIPDDGLHQSFGKMAITYGDFVKNEGFGVYKSTYVSGTEEAPFKTPTHPEPLIFKKGLSA